MSKKYKYRYLVILIVGLLILFPVYVYRKTSAPILDVIFYSFIFLILYLISYLIGTRKRKRGVPNSQNIPLLNSLIISGIVFFIIESYFVKYRLSDEHIYGVTQLITDDKENIVVSNIAQLDQCSDLEIRKNIKGSIKVLVKSINVVDRTALKDTLFKTEILYFSEGNEQDIEYFEMIFDGNCNIISTSAEKSGKQKEIRYLLERAGQNKKDLKKYDMYFKK